MITEETLQVARRTAADLHRRGEHDSARAVEALVEVVCDKAIPSLDLLTTTQAGRVLGVTGQTIKNWVQEGHLAGVRVGGRIMVARDAVAGYVRRARQSLDLDVISDATARLVEPEADRPITLKEAADRARAFRDRIFEGRFASPPAEASAQGRFDRDARFGRRPSVATRAVRAEGAETAGEGGGRPRPLVEPIVQSTVFAFDDLEAVERHYRGELGESFLYYRSGHPNAAALQRLLADLEGGEAAALAASGMAAIAALALSRCRAGDHVVVHEGAYGGTYALAREDFARLGIEVSFAAGEAEAVAAALRPTTRLVLLEAMTNPLLRVPDIAGVAAALRGRDLLLAVDASFASPALLRPLEHGARAVVHSLAKYVGGHSAAMGGAVVGGRELIESVRRTLNSQGGTIGPFDAWMAMQGARTLPRRMRAHSANALAVARWLEARSDVRAVHYPGLASHPDHARARALYPDGFGGMVSFDLAGGEPAARSFLARIGRCGIPFSPSLADVRSTVSYPAGTSHRQLPADERRAAGIGDGLIRLSVGIEDAADVVASLEGALAG